MALRPSGAGEGHGFTEAASAFASDGLSRWQLLGEQSGATSEAEQARMAEQVLAEPAVGGVAAGHASWARLRGAKSKPAPPYKPTGY